MFEADFRVLRPMGGEGGFAAMTVCRMEVGGKEIVGRMELVLGGESRGGNAERNLG